MMPFRFKDARIQSGISQKKAAEQLQVSAATVNNWETGRRLPTIDALGRMAELYGVSADYLLGRTSSKQPLGNLIEEIDKNTLPFLHDHPVFVNRDRWGLVDAVNECVRFVDGSALSFNNILQISILPPPFQSGNIPKGKRLSRDEIETFPRIWIEPISKDEALRQEIRGWYTVKDRFAENEFGIRFYLDTYENKWIAFIE